MEIGLISQQNILQMQMVNIKNVVNGQCLYFLKHVGLGSPLTPDIFASQCSIEDAAIAIMKVYKMGPEERERRGLKGREWILSEESGFTAKIMGKRFINNINKLFKEWQPQPRFTLSKVDDKSKLSNYIPTPISLTPEFLKEIQSI